ncbi:hypothetical protein CHS0354_030289 [Potamilus streckersoni]|uniref:Uncharacterized protein n=1 Tax=Potamilus streckersoni TaxID=2493646 RepID=A0AAE0T448_9BIVA|nr:hypothetical protein CHS0354_030289 [Potamilus streckersoni]
MPPLYGKIQVPKVKSMPPLYYKVKVPNVKTIPPLYYKVQVHKVESMPPLYYIVHNFIRSDKELSVLRPTVIMGVRELSILGCIMRIAELPSALAMFWRTVHSGNNSGIIDVRELSILEPVVHDFVICLARRGDSNRGVLKISGILGGSFLRHIQTNFKPYKTATSDSSITKLDYVFGA